MQHERPAPFGTSRWDLRIETTHGDIIATCRSTLGGANGGNTTRTSILMSVLRSLRREVGRTPADAV